MTPRIDRNRHHQTRQHDTRGSRHCNVTNAQWNSQGAPQYLQSNAVKSATMAVLQDTIGWNQLLDNWDCGAAFPQNLTNERPPWFRTSIRFYFPFTFTILRLTQKSHAELNAHPVRPETTQTIIEITTPSPIQLTDIAHLERNKKTAN